MKNIIYELLDEYKKGPNKIYALEKLAEISTINPFLVDLFNEGQHSIVKELIKLFEYEENGHIITRYFFDPISEELQLAVKYCDEMSIYEKQDFLDLIYKIDFEKVRNIKIKHMRSRQIIGVGHPIEKLEDVIHYFELSNLHAGIDLFNKNIETVYNDTSNCFDDQNCSNVFEEDFRDAHMYANIGINEETLTDENKIILNKLIENKKASRNVITDGIDLLVLINGEDTVGEVSDKMLAISNVFKKQDVLHKEHAYMKEKRRL